MPFASPWVGVLGVKAVLARLELANHDHTLLLGLAKVEKPSEFVLGNSLTEACIVC
jgi:hypothetical protein